MQIIRGSWVKDYIEVNSAFLATLPRNFKINLGVETIDAKRNIRTGKIILSKFHLPISQTVLVKRDNTDLSIGPVLGFMARGVDSKTVARFKHYFVQTYEGILFVFDEEAVYNKQFWGYLPDKNQWLHLELPKPSYIFDRTYPSTDTVKNNLPQSIFYNAVTQFAKIDLANLLQKNNVEVPEFHSGYLPDYLDNYSLFYLKPDRGAFGKGIFVVRKLKDGFQIFNGSDGTFEFCNREQLIKLLHDLSTANYLLQEGLISQKYQGQPFDIRVHTLIDPFPRVVFIGVRLSKYDFLFTSTPRRLLPGEKVIDSSTITRLKEVIINAIDIIKNHYGLFVELSFDVVITETGEFQIIDVNGKSTRTHPALLNYNIDQYFRAPYKLARYLFVNGQLLND